MNVENHVQNATDAIDRLRSMGQRDLAVLCDTEHFRIYGRAGQNIARSTLHELVAWWLSTHQWNEDQQRWDQTVRIKKGTTP